MDQVVVGHLHVAAATLAATARCLGDCYEGNVVLALAESLARASETGEFPDHLVDLAASEPRERSVSS